jgi:threonine/homoserine/homoserine lactone efflux protein
MDAIMILGLVGAAAASAATPGPCILMTSSRTATDGLPSGLRVVLGISAAKLILLVCSWAMILGIMTLSDGAVESLRLGGLALLVALALTMLTAPARLVAGPIIGTRRLGDTMLGLVLGMSSPVSLLFVFALLPQFVDVQRLDATSVALASGAVLLGGALPFLAACIVATRAFRGRPRIDWINRACGATLLGFAGLAAVAGS